MRILALAVLLCFVATSLSAADVRIVRVFTGWREAASFKRISEYFTGQENNRREIVLRSQPEERGGYYFLVRTENLGAATDTRFVLQVVTPDSTRPRDFIFHQSLPPGKAVFQIGLTGSDWPNDEIDPSAWRIQILSVDGATLATEKSYLWELPPGS
jgi:hypothetical protein